MSIDSSSLRVFKTKSESKTFLGLWFSSFCYFAALGFVLPFLPLLLQMSRLTYAEIGIIYMIGLVFPVFLQTLWGVLADRIGRKMIIILATIAVAIISGLYPYASSFIHFLLLGLLWYTFLAAATTVTPALVVDIAEPMTIGRRFGRYRISGSLGWIASTAIGGLISESVGIKTIFYLAAILYLLSAIIIQISIKEPPAKSKEIVTHKSLSPLIRNRNFNFSRNHSHG